MQNKTTSRREFLKNSGQVALGLSLIPNSLLQAANPPSSNRREGLVKDPVIRSGLVSAIHQNLIPAASQRFYPGHFTISADGRAYGNDTTWPGLDSWQMAGAYLLIGRTQLVLDYFRFVRASQRKDGNIPFAIFNGDTRPGGFLSGLNYPDDVFQYTPPEREGVPDSAVAIRKWIGLFVHWQPLAEPLGTLGGTCYLLTASEIFEATRDKEWLKDNISSVDRAARYLLTKVHTDGLVYGTGFYTELPPRRGCDGISQCYLVHAYRKLSELYRALGSRDEAHFWSHAADHLTDAFIKAFWRTDHFGEYLHFERGLVDSHGLSDTNFAAIAFGLADHWHREKLWPKLVQAREFWLGNVPTQTVTKPFTYEDWEDTEPVNLPIEHGNDAAAMGRAYYLEALACIKMHDKSRLLDCTRLVCKAAENGYWRERYHPQKDGTVKPAGAAKYCEYPAVLTRIVLGNESLFSK